jgi:SAM-dependent methyltransferase
MAAWFESFFEGTWLEVQRAFYAAEESDKRAEMLERVLALRPGSHVLDVPCGNGRLTIPLARRGHAVTGVDFTAPFIAEARAAAGELPATFLERDMRQLDDLSGFDAAFNFWGSFGYFDDAGDESFATGVCKALLPGGHFLIDANVTETLMPMFQPKGWMRVGETIVLEERAFDFASSRLEVDWTFIRGGARETKHLSMRLYSAHEIVGVLSRAGFSSVQLLDYATEAPLAVSSRRALILATK